MLALQLLVRFLEHQLGYSPSKHRVVTELLKKLSVILHDAVHYPDEGLIVLDPGILPPRV